MTTAFAAVVIGLALAALTLRAFAQAEPASLARLLRLTLPLALAAAGAAFIILGRAPLGIAMIVGAAAWLVLGRNRGRSGPPALTSRSVLRTAALEVELDGESRTVDGLVLAGSFEGETLAQLSLGQLRVLHRELDPDPDSVRLIETYLDRRFPAWREDA